MSLEADSATAEQEVAWFARVLVLSWVNRLS